MKPAVLNRYYELGLRTGNRQAFIDRVNTKQNIDLSRLQRIQAPTLIMWGKQDAWIPVEHAAQFQSAIQNKEQINKDVDRLVEAKVAEQLRAQAAADAANAAADGAVSSKLGAVSTKGLVGHELVSL